MKNRSYLFRGDNSRIWKCILAATCCFIHFVAISTAVLALDLKPSEIRGKAKKKPVSVLQNRYFLKALRPEVGLIGGTMLNEAYTDTVLMGARVGMFVNEWVGFEAQYLKTKIEDSKDREALNKLKFRKLDEDKVVTPNPEVNPIHRMVDLNLIGAPFYGKMNFVDYLIVYADIYLTLGYSNLDTDQGTKNALTVGSGIRFYLLESLSLRVDFKDRIFTETRAGEDDRRNALSVDFGFSYFFF